MAIDIRCNIIVEANFRIYAYLESRHEMEEQILFNLLSLFAEIKYRFPNLIIADLNDISVMRAYKKNLKAEQIIQFLEMNNHNPLQHQPEKKTSTALQQAEVKKRLSFLRVFQEESVNENPILPHNIFQQLNLWQQEHKLLT